jgi:hypothetical protein
MIAEQITLLSSVSSSSVSSIWRLLHEKRGLAEEVCHRFETLLSSALQGDFATRLERKISLGREKILARAMTMTPMTVG